tara:strand:- start:332 stop:478 length:147 start_codon:yes stop_codon:yes gene_type:complete
VKEAYETDFLKVGLIFVILFCASGCGQKGPLYYPDKDEVASSNFQNIN